MISETDRERARILVIDDARGDLAALERGLRRAGFERIRAVDDPAAAVAAFDAFAPDAVVVAEEMAGADGAALAATLRRRVGEDELLPIVLLGRLARTARSRAVEHATTDVVPKPVDDVVLAARVGCLLDIRFRQQDLRAERARLEAQVEARTRALEDEITTRRLAGDRTRLFESALRCLEDPILITDAPPEGTAPQVVYVNQAWKAAAGTGAEAILGRPPRLLFGEDGEDEDAPSPLVDAMREGPREGCSLRLRGGAMRWIHWSVTPVSPSPTTRPDHYVVVQRDVTGLRGAPDRERGKEPLGVGSVGAAPR